MKLKLMVIGLLSVWTMCALGQNSQAAKNLLKVDQANNAKLKNFNINQTAEEAQQQMKAFYQHVSQCKPGVFVYNVKVPLDKIIHAEYFVKGFKANKCFVLEETVTINPNCKLSEPTTTICFYDKHVLPNFKNVTKNYKAIQAAQKASCSVAVNGEEQPEAASE